MTAVEVYTDGACLKNPGGAGGWAYLVVGGPHASGHEAATTNNRMELMAVIQALGAVTGSPLIVYSDSQYVVKGASRWRFKWRSRDWRVGNSDEPVKNLDLWLELDQLLNGRQVEFRWVRGHDTNQHNNRVDLLALQAAHRPPAPSAAEDEPFWATRTT